MLYLVRICNELFCMYLFIITICVYKKAITTVLRNNINLSNTNAINIYHSSMVHLFFFQFSQISIVAISISNQKSIVLHANSVTRILSDNCHTVIQLFFYWKTDPTKASGQRLVGDVAFAEASEVASYITPVPGGVGPMTVAMLMKNTVQSAHKAAQRILESKWTLTHLPLQLQRPVPK